MMARRMSHKAGRIAAAVHRALGRARTGLAACLLLASAIVAVTSTGGLAGPGGLVPKGEMRSHAVVTYSFGAAGALRHIYLENVFTVYMMPEQGTLRIYRRADPSADGTGNPHLDELVEADTVTLGRTLYLVLEGGFLDTDPETRQFVTVEVQDAASGDREIVTLVETDPASGVFLGGIATTGAATQAGDNRLSTVAGSRIEARYADPISPERDLSATVNVVAPGLYGYVFDAQTDAPLDGVEITLIDMATGEPAQVFGNGTGAHYPATIRSGNDVTDTSGNRYELAQGEYRFPHVQPGTYRFAAETGNGYVIPSQSPLAGGMSMQGQGFRITIGSMLDPFTVPESGELRIDIPAERASGVAVTRRASTDRAETGDFVNFSVDIHPGIASTIDITDTLGPGLRMRPNTLRLNGAAVAPALAADGGSFVLAGQSVPAGQISTMTYTAQVAISARTGDTLTSRTEINAFPSGSASDSHRLRVNAAFDTGTVAILGQVVAGPCGGPEEVRDLSGIRIWLETGEYVTTDSRGRFSFRDIARTPHVVQIDTISLPRGARPVLCDGNTRRAGSAISQFIDVRPGLMGRAEFHIVFDEAAAEADAQAERDRPDSAWRAPQAANPADIFTMAWLNARAPGTPPQVLFPAEGYQPQSGAVELFYLRAQGQAAEVLVNGTPVPSARRDPPISNLMGTLFIDRWRGLRLDEGRNTVTLILRDAEGREVLRRNRTVLYATRPAQAEILRQSSVLETDGRSTPVVELRLTDAEGIPVRPGTQVSVRIGEPFGFVPEAEPRRGAPASQRGPVATTTAEVGQDGIIRLVLAPVLESGTAEIRIPTTGGRDIIQRVHISAAGRPWVLVGIAEGTLAARNVRRDIRHGGDILDPNSGRVAFFAEGVVRGEWLLTLRYDSARDGGGDFWGIDPDKDYIVYGDASVQGNAAQSRFPLYVRLRKEGAEFLIGDFDTDLSTALISYNRRLTGARAILEGEDDRYRIMAFAAPTNQRFIEDRFPSDGTMGPYPLSQSGIVAHSETVRLVVASRRDASEELASETLRAGRDYMLDRRRGLLHLLRPIPAFTPELDRNIIVVEYETEHEVARGWIAGARAEVDLGGGLRAGATGLAARRVDGSDVDVAVLGADLTYRFSQELTLSAEIVRTTKRFANRREHGTMAELRAEYDDGTSSLAAYFRRQKGSVALNAQSANTDLSVLGLEFSTLVATRRDGEGATVGTVHLEGALRGERNHRAGTSRLDAELMLVRREERLDYGSGLRLTRKSGPDGSSTALRALARAQWTTEDGRMSMGIAIDGRVRGDLGRAGPDLANLSMRYRMNDRIAVFANMETAQGATGKRVAVVGLESLSADGMRSLSGGVVHASNGTARGHAVFFGGEQRIELREGLELSLGIDAQHDLGANDVPMGGEVGNPYIDTSFVTARAGLSVTRDTWSASVETEARFTRDERTQNLRLRADGELTDAWTVAGAAFVGQTQVSGGADRRNIDLRVSAAHRTGAHDPITLLQAEIDYSAEGDNETERRAYVSAYHSRYLSARDTLNARYGAKFIESSGPGGRSRDVLNFVGAEYRRDITDKLDVGLHGALMHSSRQRALATSVGVSLGFTPFENGWISAGYNFRGFRDSDFSQNGHTDKGAFVQFRFKFDQMSLSDLFF
jgi:hypothetical protein